MRILADESCDFRVIRALRSAGHDVKAVIEFSPGNSDDTIIALAVEEGRLFITEDRDFGQIVYASGDVRKTGAGVILIRFPSTARRTLPSLIVDFVGKRAGELRGRFVVVEPGRIRLGPRPEN